MQEVGRIQPDPRFYNLSHTPPWASNCNAIMVHAMALGSIGESFDTMSEGVQV